MSGSIDDLYLDYAFVHEDDERSLEIKLKASGDTGPYLVDRITIPLAQLLDQLDQARRETEN